MLTDPNERLALLAATLEDSIATVFRQIAMNRFEHAVHTARRGQGELAIEAINELWAQTQTDMLGPSVEITEGYRNWWSYIPHFIHTPGYVYAYAYGQLLALSVYRRYEQVGEGFVPQYLDMLRAGVVRRRGSLRVAVPQALRQRRVGLTLSPTSHHFQLHRMRLMPLMNALCSISGSSMICMLGKRLRISSNITLISRRARFAI